MNLLDHKPGRSLITFTAILTLPWVFKFPRAPLIDELRSARFGFNRWIGLSQVFMCLSQLLAKSSAEL